MEIQVLKEKLNQIDELPISLAEKIEAVFGDLKEAFKMDTIYQVFENEKKTTIRGRIYRDLQDKGLIVKLGKGIYKFQTENAEGIILQGNARELGQLKEASIHLIIADHPYPIASGTNKNFNGSYIDTTFKYEQSDFDNKARVLIDGGFLVEFLPEMKETNIDYICSIIQLAKKSGFNFYAKVPWYKAELRNGKIVDGSAFIGRKAILEEVYIFTKGKPRVLRERMQGDKLQKERGAKSMLPAIFMEPTRTPKKRVHQAEKPISLLKRLIEIMSNKKEFVLDQFSGSFHTFYAALELERNAIAIEINEDFIPLA